MNFKEHFSRSLGYRFQNISAWFKSLDIQKKYGSLIIRNKGSDIRVFKQIFIDEVYFFFPGNFKPKFIIDAGANTGYSSIWFSSRFPDSKIIAVEPEENNFKILSKNIHSNKNIFPLQSALWYEETFLKLDNPNADNWAFKTVVAKDDKSKKIKAVTLPKILEIYSEKKIDLLKIDIEGAEFELFKNKPEEWLYLVDTIMIEIHDNLNPGCSELIDEILENSGYSKFITKELSIYMRQ